MLVLESASSDVVEESPAEHMLRQLREQGRRAPSPPNMSKQKWVKNKEAALKAAASEKSTGVQHLGPARRAVEDKLDVLRSNPQLLEALQKRIAGSQGDAVLRAKELIAHNTAQLYDTVRRPPWLESEILPYLFIGAAQRMLDFSHPACQVPRAPGASYWIQHAASSADPVGALTIGLL